MTQQEFALQMERLRSVFGDRAYPDERVKIIWQEVKNFEAQWWKSTVDRFIGSLRQPPLVPEISQACAEERERGWQAQKEQESNEIRAFMKSSFGPDDERTIIQAIIKRVTHEMPDSDFQSFSKMLDNVAKSIPSVNCRRCEDTGLIWARHREHRGTYGFKCRCRSGLARPILRPFWSDDYANKYELEFGSGDSA